MPARKVQAVGTEQGRVVGLSVGESVKLYAERAGLQNDQRLADAAAELLPPWVTMNRNLIQKLQRDEVSVGEGANELQLIAIARVVGVPETWLGIDPYESGDLSRLKDLLIWAPESGGDPGERRGRANRSPSHQGKRDKRWTPESAGQAVLERAA